MAGRFALGNRRFPGVALWMYSWHVATKRRTPFDPKEDQMKKLLALMCMLAVGSLALADDKYPDISHDELKAAISAKKVTLLDVTRSRLLRAACISWGLLIR